MEKKNLTSPFEIKSFEESGAFEGYASVFDVEDFDGDVISKGAFTKAVTKAQNGKMPKMLWQHNPSMIVGKFTEMTETDQGLFVKGQLIQEVQKGAEAYALMKEGVLDAMSVGFNITQATNRKGGGRDIADLELWEISLVTWGANPEALISNVKGIETEREFEKFLRDSGFSKKEACAIASRGFKAKSDRDDAELVKTVNEIINKLRTE